MSLLFVVLNVCGGGMSMAAVVGLVTSDRVGHEGA
ncbi:hypothetical protein DFR75_11631 [Nocardia ignorata]|uniref:Uncharacterized protein n=1 Tax=Nocardia ignorata TaxID=145285 RepID=A0A4R6NZG7_NOCIG|nr:hypothetical protein DFR75_11631 [Nocardia ignorata]